MDQFDRIIRDVQAKTGDEMIRWDVVNAANYSHILLNVSRVIRAFKADYPIREREYGLLFVERRVDNRDEFGDSSESHGFELFILDGDGQLVLSLYEGVVDREDLLRLASFIDDHNDRVRSFFEAFNGSGAV